MSSEEPCEPIEYCEDEEDGEGGEYEEYEECEDIEEHISSEIAGLITGFVCIFLGFILSIIGVTGFINWSFAFGGINSSLTNAAPGGLLIVVGLLIIIVTNHKVTVQK